MPGQTRWSVLAPHVISIEPARAKGRLWDTGAGYPAARFEQTGSDIPGVLVRVAPELLADVLLTLDRIECEGVLFRRVQTLTSAGPASAYEWIGPTEGMRQLLSGWHDPF